MIRNPIFEAAMKRRMRSFRAPLLLMLYGLFLIVVSLGALATLQRAEVSLGNLRAGLETYIYLSATQFLLIILVAPALTAGSIAGERERQTLDLLLCTRVSALSIVLGKLLSCACFLALLIVSSLPVMAIALFFGGIGLLDMLVMLLFLIVTAFACCAIGIFCSAVFKRTVTATVVAYLSIFALGIGSLLIPMILQLDQLAKVTDAVAVSMTYAGSGAVMIGSAGGAAIQTTAQLIGDLPKLLFLNPAVGLLSLLVSQTGLLQSTVQDFLGYRGNQLYSLFDGLGSIAGVNMLVLLAISIILIALSALFVKPQGLKAMSK